MRPAARRFLWTTLAAVVAVALGLWMLRSAGPGPSPGDGAGAAADAGAAGTPDSAAPDAAAAGAEGLDVAELDLGEVPGLPGGFEPPASPRVQRWTLLRDGREVGSFRTEILQGQEGMVELRFRLGTDDGPRRGSVTTIPRFVYRYAREAVEADTGSPLPLLTVLAPPALDAVLRVREEGGPGEEGADPGEAVTVNGVAGRRFTSTVGEVRIETVAAPDLVLPLRVRTTLPDGTVLEARPPAPSP